MFAVGDPRDVLRSVARTEPPAGVVVGTRGLGPVGQRLLGSVTRSLVNDMSSWPVIVVPSPRDCLVWHA